MRLPPSLRLALASLASDGAISGTAATYRLASAARSCPDTALATAAGIGLVVMRTTARRPGGPLSTSRTASVSAAASSRRPENVAPASAPTTEPASPVSGWTRRAGRAHPAASAPRQADHQVGHGVLRTLKLIAGTASTTTPMRSADAGSVSTRTAFSRPFSHSRKACAVSGPPEPGTATITPACDVPTAMVPTTRTPRPGVGLLDGSADADTAVAATVRQLPSRPAAGPKLVVLAAFRNPLIAVHS